MTAFAKNGSIGRFGEPEIKFTQPAFPSAGWIGISNHSGEAKTSEAAKPW
jgi:hypothetical protein